MQLMTGKCTGESEEEVEEEEETEDVPEEEDRKFSINPIGQPTLSSNPFGEIAAPQRKTSKSPGA